MSREAEEHREVTSRADAETLSRAEVVRAIARLAHADTRRGVDHWFDPELTEALRELALGSASATAKPPSRPGSAPPAAALSPATTREPATNPETAAIPSETPPPARLAGSAPPVRPAAPPGSAPPAPPAASPTATSARVPAWGAPPLATGRDSDWHERLAALGERAAGCRRCALCETRNKVVFGVGSAAVSLVFVGEAPGADEDREGFPFVGRAGQLLDKIIRAIGLERDEIYICNVLKCRPPGNRNPEPEEIAKCTPFLEEQLAILRPKVICSLGLFASQFLAGSALPIGKLRGRVLDYGGTPLIPTYHPAALLRNPGLKAATWDDVQLVRQTLDR